MKRLFPVIVIAVSITQANAAPLMAEAVLSPVQNDTASGFVVLSQKTNALEVTGFLSNLAKGNYHLLIDEEKDCTQPAAQKVLSKTASIGTDDQNRLKFVSLLPNMSLEADSPQTAIGRRILVQNSGTQKLIACGLIRPR